ncbi:hypothetical protein Fleli_2864 [Bernardetia litoralis DSM 6794]|uniref:Uncharacterized protein n=1 Tax=Bernardetia litoralis (strain ATCC 23117 / DSM 6794 / NBRC 15988 / NCIMB 1366 / Fx l1 / Sio-4) TaxID=880071 RepID=I4AMN2_BERLS|nr:hypothetical protein [Bernardetia litoralis]AFM05217.1 hypothetical protein Fleli_2864 [Bernardetia litoralis DSM 6794]
MINALQLQTDNYKNLVKELIGKSIISVNYYEIDRDKPYWDKGDHHSLDYGLEIEMNDSQTYYFIWDKEFIQYDMKFAKGEIQQEFSVGVGKHLITDSKWNNLLGEKIVSVETIWINCSINGDKKHYPETIKLHFKNNKSIWISAVEIRENITPYMADHVSVFFDEMTMRKYNVLTENEL